jgi:exonuclease VII small subunit
MSTPAIDTHAFVKRITAAGMPEAQAEVLAEALAERPVPVTKGAVTHAVETLGRAVDKRLASLERGQASLEKGQASLEKGQAALEKGQAALEKGQASLEKGQAVLMENQLEANRALSAIMAHLGIPKQGA